MLCVNCGRRFSYRTPGYKKLDKEQRIYLCPKCAGYSRPTTLFSRADTRSPWTPGTYITRPWERRKKKKRKRAPYIPKLKTLEEILKTVR